MKTLLLISPDPLFTAAADHILSAHFRTVIPCEIASAIDIIYNDTPDLLVVDLAAGDKATVAFINNLKDDPLFSPLPILVVVGEQQPVAARWEDLFVEDWLRRSDLERDLLSRVQLAVVRSGRTVEVNPLTRLPGNISINRQIQKRMGLEHFSLAYADLSDFKPFN
ncbi:MAG: hypothetical protein FWE89_05670, partial [Syntrophaceae bacterium]|nr:hypothetical protein [Syntrophaceae bacterium]